nr:hypothetical transcript [Hymenolepis microstoma]
MNRRGKSLNKEIPQAVSTDFFDELKRIPSIASIKAHVSLVTHKPTTEKYQLQAEGKVLGNAEKILYIYSYRMAGFMIVIISPLFDFELHRGEKHQSQMGHQVETETTKQQSKEAALRH